MKDVLFDMTAFFVCSYLFISIQWLTKDRSGSFWCSVGNYFLIWHPNWLGISDYIKEFSSWIAQQSSIGALQHEDKKWGRWDESKKGELLSILFCAVVITRGSYLFPAPLTTSNPMLLFSEVASELLCKESGSVLKNFQVALIENYEAGSCRPLAICIFSLQN